MSSLPSAPVIKPLARFHTLRTDLSFLDFSKMSPNWFNFPTHLYSMLTSLSRSLSLSPSTLIVIYPAGRPLTGIFEFFIRRPLSFIDLVVCPL